jgi:hypothetical protein
MFQDSRWVTKVLIGGLFYILCFLLVGIPFILGYCARLARNVANGDPQPLPEWDDIGGYFVEGLRLVAVGFVYVLPFFALIAAFVVPMGILGSLGNLHNPNDVTNQIAGSFASGALSCVWCLMVPVSLLFSFWIPGALLFASIEQRFGAAFEFGRIFAFIRNNLANYLIAFVIYLIARFAAGFGLILFCIGVVLTAFWSMIVSTYAFAYAYRLARK